MTHHRLPLGSLNFSTQPNPSSVKDEIGASIRFSFSWSEKMSDVRYSSTGIVWPFTVKFAAVSSAVSHSISIGPDGR